jgi:hypothetical protein
MQLPWSPLSPPPSPFQAMEEIWCLASRREASRVVRRGSIGGREYDGDGGGRGAFGGQLIRLLSEQMYMGMKRKWTKRKQLIPQKGEDRSLFTFDGTSEVSVPATFSPKLSLIRGMSTHPKNFTSSPESTIRPWYLIRTALHDVFVR